MAKAARKSRLVQSSPPPKLGRTELLIGAGLLIVTIAVYARVVSHQFISLDDDLYIRDNPMVNGGLSWAGLFWAFTTFHAANWHPITWLAHMFDSEIFGLNAGGHIFSNVLIHAANTVLVFLFFCRTTKRHWPSAVIAALFALHPLHVESVAWAAERKDTLATFFGLVSLMAYVRYLEAPSRGRYAWIAIALVLGLMCKPVLVTWPFLMLLLDYWPLRRLPIGGTASVPSGRDGARPSIPVPARLIIEKLPLVGIVIASAIVTFIAQSHGGAVRTVVDAPLWLRLSNAIVSYAKYLFLTFWPHDLAVYYPFDLTGIPIAQVVGAALLLIAITVLCIYQTGVRPYLLIGWLWFLGTLIPMIGIVQVGGQALADRYHYLPSIGLFAALVFAGAEVLHRMRVGLVTTTAITGILLGTLVYATSREVDQWRDSETLFEKTLAVTPPNLIIEHNLGLVLGHKGQYDAAAMHFEKALLIKPDFFEGLLHLGITRAKQRRYSEAVGYFENALRVQPDSSKVHSELALVFAGQNNNEAALRELQRAAQLAPQDSDIRTNLGLMLARSGRFPEAIDVLHQAIRLAPNSAEAHNNLGLALLVSGKPRESIPEFETAMRLKPELSVAAENLRRARAQLNLEK